MNKQIEFKHNNIDYLLFNTKKTKSIRIIIEYIRPTKLEDITYYSLLGRLIGSTTKNYKSKKELANKLNSLYDASMYMTTSYSYLTACNEFRFQIINGKLVNDDNLMGDAMSLFEEIIFRPNIINNAFPKKDFDEEVKSLESDIKSIYNNKGRYAYRKLLEMIAPNDIFSASTLGDLNVLKTITPESLYDFYQNILNDSKVIVGVIGDITQEEVIKYLGNLPLKSNNDLSFLTKPKAFKVLDKVNEKKEYQDIAQAKLVMGFNYDIDVQSKYYVPLLVFNAMFGSMFSSTIVKVIREEKSLSYDISSSLVLNKKFLFVSGGIERKNVDKCCDIVIKELEKYKQGIIDEQLLNVAKEFMINDLKQLEDSPGALLGYYLTAILTGKIDIDTLIKDVYNVTLEDIRNVSNLVSLHSIFQLLPGDANE